MADNQVTEKEQLKANSQADGADSKTTLSHEAFDNAVKQAQAAGASGASGKDLHVSEQAKGGSVESLPGIILHGGADKSQQGDANHSKQGPADNGKHGGSEQLNQKLDANEAKNFGKDAKSNDLNELSKTKEFENLGKALKDGDLTKEQYNQKMIDFVNQKDGVQKLATGDYIVKEDGKQTLFTPNGDHITLNPDGTNSVKGDISKVSTDKDGMTTVQFGDGSSATFDKEGFHNVTRGNKSVSLLNDGILESPLNKPYEPLDPYHIPNPWPRNPGIVPSPSEPHHHYDPIIDYNHIKPVMDWNHNAPIIDNNKRIDDLKKYSPAQTDNLKSRD